MATLPPLSRKRDRFDSVVVAGMADVPTPRAKRHADVTGTSPEEVECGPCPRALSCPSLVASEYPEPELSPGSVREWEGTRGGPRSPHGVSGPLTPVSPQLRVLMPCCVCAPFGPRARPLPDAYLSVGSPRVSCASPVFPPGVVSPDDSRSSTVLFPDTVTAPDVTRWVLACLEPGPVVPSYSGCGGAGTDTGVLACGRPWAEPLTNMLPRLCVCPCGVVRPAVPLWFSELYVQYASTKVPSAATLQAFLGAVEVRSRASDGTLTPPDVKAACDVLLSILDAWYSVSKESGTPLTPSAAGAAKNLLSVITACCVSVGSVRSAAAGDDRLRVPLAYALRCEHAEVVEAACRAVVDVAHSFPPAQERLCAPVVVDALLRVLDSRIARPRVLACRAVGMLAAGCPAARAHLTDTVAPLVRASSSDVQLCAVAALWTLGLVVNHNAVNQAAAVEAGGLATVQALLHGAARGASRDRGDTMLLVSAAAALCSLCAGNRPIAQQLTDVPSLLRALLTVCSRSVDVPCGTDKGGAAVMLVLSLFPEHADLVVDDPATPLLIHKMLVFPSPLVQRTAALLVRQLAVNCVRRRTLLVGMGVLPPLVNALSAATADAGVQDQMALTLFALAHGQPAALQILHSVRDTVGVLSRGLRCSKSSVSRRMCLTGLLADLIGDARSGPAVVASLKDDAALVRSIALGLTMGDAKLKAFTSQVLRRLAPDTTSWAPVIATTCLQELNQSSTEPAVNCAVCLNYATDVVHLPCFHSFHAACVQDWVATGRDECPLCRAPIVRSVLKLLVRPTGGV